jgi:hypothetical protein
MSLNPRANPPTLFQGRTAALEALADFLLKREK